MLWRLLDPIWILRGFENLSTFLGQKSHITTYFISYISLVEERGHQIYFWGQYCGHKKYSYYPLEQYICDEYNLDTKFVILTTHLLYFQKIRCCCEKTFLQRFFFIIENKGEINFKVIFIDKKNAFYGDYETWILLIFQVMLKLKTAGTCRNIRFNYTFSFFLHLLLSSTSPIFSPLNPCQRGFSCSQGRN